MIPSQSRQIYTPTKLNRLVRTLLQSELGVIWLSAEISNFVRASSGHWYFTLKDNKAQIRAAMFKQANRVLSTQPKEGDKVLVRASVGLYEPRGDYQLIVEYLEPEGLGKLKQEFEKLKAKLSAEGLFNSDTKQSVPKLVKRIGVITSPTGAAIHDVLSVLQRRCPDIGVVIYPAIVQGEQSPSSLRNALSRANERNEVDVLLLTRGGGSLEDLWSFNNEQLARDVQQSAIPVVSAVGHEVDVTIADFAADLRAPTPSAAAELVSPDKQTRLNRLSELSHRLQHSIIREIKLKRTTQLHNAQALAQRHPLRQLNQLSQTLDNLEFRLVRTMQRTMEIACERRRYAVVSFNKFKPEEKLNAATEAHRQGVNRLQQVCSKMLSDKMQHLQQLGGHLHAVSPLATLGRGYTLSKQNDRIVTSASQVDKSMPLMTQWQDGTVTTYFNQDDT